MATLSLTSLRGKLLGLTRPTTAFPTPRLFSKGGFMANALYMSTAEGSEALVDLAGFTDVETSSTATAALTVRGISVIAAGASTLYTLAGPPGTGVRKTLMTASTSTALRQVVSAAHIVRGVSSSLQGGDNGIIAASSAHTVLSFSGIGHCIELVSQSTGNWLCVGVSGFSTTATPLTTV